jgi:poly(beta-D-mannuronate) lyase
MLMEVTGMRLQSMVVICAMTSWFAAGCGGGAVVSPTGGSGGGGGKRGTAGSGGGASASGGAGGSAGAAGGGMGGIGGTAGKGGSTGGGGAGRASDGGGIDEGSDDAAVGPGPETGGPPADAGGPDTPPVMPDPPMTCTRRVPAASLAQLASAIEGAVAGDCVVMANGSYQASATIPIAKQGTAAARITITAESIGGVTISGAAGLRLDAPSAYVTVRGFRFTHAGGMRVAAGTSNVLVTRNHFEIPGGGTFLILAGTDNVVSYNSFFNKTTVGAFLRLDEDAITFRPHAHHNHFRNHTYAGGNGGEAITVFSVLPRVEHNLLEEIHVNGECISVKEGGGSMGGFYRFNTLRNITRGTLTLRYARRDVVEGNFFIGTPGLRAYGKQHRIRNNYFEGGQIILGDGTTTSFYIGIDDMEVSFNTLVNARITGQPRAADGVPPKNMRIANNIIQLDQGEALAAAQPFTNVTYEGNILWGAAAPGAIPASGFRRVDPQLQGDQGARYRLGPASPAIDSAAGSYQAGEDIEGQPRTRPDVGADEQSSGPVLRRPLTAADVGPNAP